MLRKADLGPLFCFDAVVRHGSLVAAANALHITHGAVSHQLKALEERLGVSLFKRDGRRLRLTAAGEQLSEATQSCFAKLGTALADVKVAEIGPLVVSCEPTIAMKWLIPQLSDFYAEFPEIGVHLHTAGGPVDFKRQQVDIALRRNDFTWDEDTIADKVCDEWIAPVFAPGFVAARGGVDVSRDTLLHSARRPTAWGDWANASGQIVTSERQEEFEHFHLSLQAAEAGLGVAIGSFFMVAEEVRSGRLLAPFGFRRDGSSYVVLRPKTKPEMAADLRCDTFHTWLKKRLSATLQQMPTGGK